MEIHLVAMKGKQKELYLDLRKAREKDLNLVLLKVFLKVFLKVI